MILKPRENALSIWKYQYFQKCVFCGESDFERKGRRGTGEPFHQQVVQCKRCGLLFVNPIADTESMALYYRGYGEAHPVDARIPEKTCRDAKKLIAMASPKSPPRFLDAGAGSGALVKAFQDIGWEGYGIELSESAVQFARESRGITTIQMKPIEDCEFPESYFDIVNFWHVIEHLRDPFLALGKIAHWLKSGGMLHLGTPNPSSPDALLASWLNGRFGLGADHTFGFPPPTLRRMVIATGLSVAGHKVYARPRSGPGVRKWTHNLARRLLPFTVSHFQEINAIKP
jgi:2-polyprenyl-3-methyl-5-hydroxy-6-metoxy-1,4-benzoquinol methylase